MHLHRPRERGHSGGLACALVAVLLACLALPALAAARTYDVTLAPYRRWATASPTTVSRSSRRSRTPPAAGGGTVLVPAGRTFLSGGIRLRSNVIFQSTGRSSRAST